MTTAGHSGTLAATNGPAQVMENLQQSLGEGPWLTAFHDQRPVLEHDRAGAGAHWPGFAPAATESGIAAVFAFPLQAGAVRLGVLDLYRNTPGPLDSLQLGEALDYAAAATTILLDLQHDTTPDKLHSQFVHAVDSHRDIHQATGIIAVQAGVSMNEALLITPPPRAAGPARPGKAAANEPGEMFNELADTTLNSRVLLEQAKGVISERAGITVEHAFTLLRAYARRNRRQLTAVASAVIDGTLAPSEFTSGSD
ncbi:GAF and ANTAR domain-containing protein [Kribbella sp. NPDC056861]|uniref:GAF and ANTAR domain-containing protein n=1 Tax=Kribbella sp. NPDC056861 TaxID=3154857 RepID=UPI003417B9B2